MSSPAYCPHCKNESLLMCPHCHRRFKFAGVDRGQHFADEIDPWFPVTICAGALRSIWYSPEDHECVCIGCGKIYPDSLSCCPRLVEFALELMTYHPVDCGPRTHEIALKFVLMDHKDSLLYHLEQTLRVGKPDDCDIVRRSGVLAHVDPKFSAIRDQGNLD